MSRNEMRMISMRTLLSCTAIALVGGFGVSAATAGPILSAPTFAAATAAVQDDDREARRRKGQTLSQSTAKQLGEAFNLINTDPPDYAKALSILNNMASRDLKPFDRSTVLEIRGGVYAAQENYNASLRDYVEVLNIDALPYERLRQIRYNVAQLYFVNENYAQAIKFMREYLEGVGGNVEDANAWYILAAAYVSQNDYRSARTPGENVIKYDKKHEKKNYDLLNLIYSELGLDVQRGRLLETMIEYFPNEESYWAQLSGSYSQAGRDLDAFATLEVAYKAGLIRDEDKIVALGQYYSALDNPYRGAKLIEREMANGVVKKNLKNYELLAQLWSMARNQPKAIDALNAAAQLAPSGELYYRLGQSYMADENYAEAVRNLRKALQRGGLKERDVGDIRLLLGAALFNMDSETAAGRAAARREFVRAQQFSRTRRDANGWVSYIDAIEATLKAQADVERAQAAEARRREIERCESIIDVFELGGDVDKVRLEECRAIVAEAAAEEAGDAAPVADEAAADDTPTEEAPTSE